MYELNIGPLRWSYFLILLKKSNDKNCLFLKLIYFTCSISFKKNFWFQNFIYIFLYFCQYYCVIIYILSTLLYVFVFTVGGNKPENMVSVYGVPLVSALKLLRIIACRSRNMASELVQKFGIAETLASYISVDPRLVNVMCIMLKML